LAGRKPAAVNDTAIVFVDADVFFIVINLDICGKTISLVAPFATVDDVTNGVADT
jgi:hypothetical protein